MRLGRVLSCAALTLAAANFADAQIAGRIVEDLDITEHPGYVDVSILFTCGLRYINHLPSSEGDILRIRTVPGRDCSLSTDGLAPPTLPTNKRSYIQGIDLDRPITTEVDITIHWRQSEKFLVLPTGDERGVRIRLLRAGEQRGSLIIGEVPGRGSANYAINLDSSHEPFDDAAIAAASQVTGVRVYVSEYTLDEEKWFRLRLGPFATEDDAKRTLLTARNRYPKAWLAVSDDDVLNIEARSDSIARAVEPPNTAVATLTDADIDAAIKQAKAAFRKKDYNVAIPLLQKLLDQPEFPQRAEAQELMGLARERNRQIAHAKAEYEEYLRRYPKGPAVERVQQRLRALNLAARKSVPGLAAGAGELSPWKIYGGFAQLYRKDDSTFQNGTDTVNAVSQNSLLNDFALVARRHGERFDFASRVGASYIKNFIDNGLGNQTRVSAAVVELSDRQLGWRARLGRQSVTGSGIYGTFDGAYGDYQLLPRVRLSLAAGAPLETTATSYDSNRRFVALAANFGPFLNAWDIAAYSVAQQYQGQPDRRALGTEVHYFAPGRTVIGLLDYDFYYRELNNILLIGTFELPARWSLNFDYDHRNAPILSVRNALIGQSATSLADLLSQFTRDEIDQFARDRTAVTDLYTVSLSRPVGEHWQWTVDASRILTGATPESGGVQAVAAIAPEMAYSVLAIGNSVFTSGDLNVLVLRYQNGETLKTTSLGLSSRWPLWGAWRLGPRARVDKRLVVFNDSTQWLYVPSLRLDYQRSRVWLEFEGGEEIGKIGVGTQDQKTTRTYFSLGYRINF